MSKNINTSALLDHLEEDFGANASYVETLLDRYLSSPSLLDDSWKVYFSDLLQDPNIAKLITTPLSRGATNGIANGLGIGGAASGNPLHTSLPEHTVSNNETAEPFRGASKKVVENMEQSLGVPTATSVRYIPVKLLDENRRLINGFLSEQGGGKTSYTHIIAWALLRAFDEYPQLNDGFAIVDGNAVRLKRPDINLGVAVDVQKRDGSRSLLVPNIKRGQTLTFKEFLDVYDDIIQRSRKGKLDISDFEGTTISLTNPGTIGTVGSVPRLMAGQGLIIGTGAIEYPAEYQAMDQTTLSQLGISKVVQVTSTYDHRIVQGAESGAMLARMHELLLGKHGFYDNIFRDLGIPYRPLRWSVDHNPNLFSNREAQQMRKQASVLELIRAYRDRGHLIANIDPLHAIPVHYDPELDIEAYGLTIWDLDREFVTEGLGGVQKSSLRDIVDILRRSYCGNAGVEYMHISNKEQKTWLREHLESAPKPVDIETKKAMLWKLISAEQFEHFLHNNFLGQKRFSVEGSETMVALLDQLILSSASRGTSQIFFGMSHRGRLNFLANVLGHFCERIFTAFIGSVHPNFPADEGDVKYHQGAKAERELESGKKVTLTLSPNPSHLEFVDPVVEGMTRATQDHWLQTDESDPWTEVLPVVMHGDAAFAGQGIVMETLNLVNLRGYRTGGTIHIIINNQIGFTTTPEAGRSTLYSTDIAKMTELPIFHVNGDHPEEAYRILQIALDFRFKFHKDVVIDLIGFRRLGHNEGDEPSYTQPLMYAKVKAHPGVRKLYSNHLVKEGIYTQEEIDALIQKRNAMYTDALSRAKEVALGLKEQKLTPPVPEEDGSELFDTSISVSEIGQITQQISIIPDDFHLNPKMVSQLARRSKMGDGTNPIEWAFGEALAFGSLVLEGTSVRLSGQDSGRGTFSQRHAVLYDIESGQPWTPLSLLKPPEGSAAKFQVFDSSLSEQGVLGFEYGYSIASQRDLVMWEAQFGDFANVAQVIIDQFVASAEDKWKQLSSLVMLLPHGYEGQGPEHSSARLERFLQLSAENNLQVAYPTTPAQYCHLLRRQAKQEKIRPLIIMTPKSLLRLPAATSSLDEFTRGAFHPVLHDSLSNKSKVKRIVLCSGKIYYDLLEARTNAKNEEVALIRLEQFYPWPKSLLQSVVGSYANASEVFWVQEEPKNMGGWTFVNPKVHDTLPQFKSIRFVGRARSASPAIGVFAHHVQEQQSILSEALTL